jgi:hypothetical protein
MEVEMARTGRAKAELVLTDEERLTPRAVGEPAHERAGVGHASPDLCCAKAGANRAVAGELRVSEAMVGKWRRRFMERRLNGLFDEPRPGHPRTISDERSKR